MDKFEFMEKAPQYYALGIAVALHNMGAEGKRASTINQLAAALSPEMRSYIFERDRLVNEAAQLLSDCGYIKVMKFDFAPTVYRATDDLAGRLQTGPNNKLPLFDVYRELKDLDWLISGILTVNEKYNQIGIIDADFMDRFVDPNGEPEWEPIPLDRSDERLITATTKLDEAIQQIEQDNGYAVSSPGERDYVIENLKHVSKILKEQGKIYVMQLKTYAIEPLVRVINRFGPAAAGVAAATAKEALKDWLKGIIAHGLDNLRLPW